MSSRTSSTATAAGPASGDSAGLTQRNATPSKAEFFQQGNNGGLMPYVAATHEERYSILDRRLAKEQKTLGLGLLKTLGMITVALWIALPIFWGSLYLTLQYLSNLTIYLVDLDTAASGSSAIVGPAFRAMASNSNAMSTKYISTAHLGYVIRDAADYPRGVYDAMDEVTNKDCWGAIVVNANATSAWRAAVESGDASYDPSGAVGVFYQGARYYQIILLYLAPFMVRNTRTALQTASSAARSTILASLSNTFTAPSSAPASSQLVTTTLGALQAVPQALATPFGFYQHDLRVQTQWAAAAVFEASDIYYLIFAFQLCLWGNSARQKTQLGKKLTLRSLIGLRFMIPVFFYFFLSLWYTCVMAAFQIPFTPTIGPAGFIVQWMLNYLLLLAIGLALETMISVLTQAFLPFFLILWIILNITSSFQPIELMMDFYKFLRWLPFFHHTEASKIIMFNTAPGHALGVHFGALCGVVGVNIIGLSLAVWFERWRDERMAKRERRKMEEKERKEKRGREDFDRGESGADQN
ncbi:hypothetical protein NCC49_004122 [Naganishia albida]|nr:hypothetical protein NCC49_004122 [Naganishia albida]